MTIADHMIDSLMVENDDLRERIIEFEDENARLDRRRRSLQADVERLSGIIHRQRKELNMMQHAIECRNDENAKLQDENARFRSCLSDDAENARQIMGENAKLRELVRDMWRDGMCECDERGACEACEYGYLDRMRELGIEVTDD